MVVYNREFRERNFKENIAGVFTLGQATIEGTCNVEGAKVYVESNPSIYTYVVNGTYSIKVSSGEGIFLIFEADGYNNVRKAFGQPTLENSAINNVVITYNAKMTAK